MPGRNVCGDWLSGTLIMPWFLDWNPPFAIVWTKIGYSTPGRLRFVIITCRLFCRDLLQVDMLPAGAGDDEVVFVLGLSYNEAKKRTSGCGNVDFDEP
jgi:hypothetical protein